MTRKQLLAVAKKIKRECIDNGDPVKDYFDEEEMLLEFVLAYLEDHGGRYGSSYNP